MQKGTVGTSIGQRILLLLVWGSLVYGMFAVIGELFQPGDYLYDFFCLRGPIQYVTTALFWWAALILAIKFLVLRREFKSAGRLVVPNAAVPQNKADETAGIIVPQRERKTRLGQAVYEICGGFGRGEDIDVLLDKQTEKCRHDFERSYSLLNVLKQVLPLLGFLGTVIGLSAGMIAFAHMTTTGLEVGDLRNLLQQFAASLSSAFDTTLLALGYTVILILATALVRKKEDSLMNAFEQFLREELLPRFCKVGTPAQEWYKAMHEVANITGAKFEAVLGQAVIRSLAIFERRMNNGISGIVDRWATNCLDAVSRTTQTAFEKMHEENNRWGEAFADAIHENAGLIAERLERVELAALRRPRIEIRTSEDSQED